MLSRSARRALTALGKEHPPATRTVHTNFSFSQRRSLNSSSSNNATHAASATRITSTPPLPEATFAATSGKPSFVTVVEQDQKPAPRWTAGTTKERPLDQFIFGAHPITGKQVEPVKQVRIPKFVSLEAEREHRKLHHAAALRWLGQNGYNNEGGGGHVTVRDPIMPDHFWINPHNVSFSHMTPDDLCLVNEQGIVIAPGNMHAINPAGFSIHLAVHHARPDVVAACHCHSVPSKAFAALGCELEPISQDACRFYNNHSIYNNFGGIVLAQEEGRRIASAMGNKAAVILQNHGILTVGKSVDAAVFLFGAMDRCIQAQLMADAAAAGRGKPTVKISHESAEYTRNVYTDEMEYNMFQSAFEDVVRGSNGALPMRVQGEQIRPRD